MRFLAQEAATNSTGTLGDVTPFINLGLSGIWLLAFLKSWVVPGSQLQAERTERLELQKKYDALVDTIRVHILPEMERSREANEQLADTMEKLMQR